MSLFPGFEHRRIRTSGATINLVVGGDGPPVLMLHGYPQTHAMWHKLAPKLAKHYTVVCPDLRGYGDSSKPKGLPDHSNYSKRVMALDMVEVMNKLGHASFHLVGHDRGGRVGHRLARDHGSKVARTFTVLDICPTLKMFESTNMEFAGLLPLVPDAPAGAVAGEDAGAGRSLSYPVRAQFQGLEGVLESRLGRVCPDLLGSAHHSCHL